MFVLNTLQGDWGEAWENIKEILSSTWTIITEVVVGSLAQLLALFLNFVWQALVAFSNFGVALGQAGVWAMANLWAAMVAGFGALWNWLASLPSRIRGAFRNALGWLKQAGRNIIQGLWSGAVQKWNSFKKWLSGITSLIPRLKGPPEVDLKLLRRNGQLVMEGFRNGLEDGWNDVDAYLRSVSNEDDLDPNLRLSVPRSSNGDLISALYAIAAANSEKVSAGLYVEGDVILGEDAGVDDLDWWAKSEGAGV